jgi:hypothetical protein
MSSAKAALFSPMYATVSIESTRALMCLNDWTSAGYVSKDDIEEAARLPEIK